MAENCEEMWECLACGFPPPPYDGTTETPGQTPRWLSHLHCVVVVALPGQIWINTGVWAERQNLGRRAALRAENCRTVLTVLLCDLLAKHSGHQRSCTPSLSHQAAVKSGNYTDTDR
ncbi:hypothetical protein Bbelb_043340 [Branchiostoma belcheri]|nr:hypothetical protein Bbelb_043340 [Branchiostoma belcheri]